MTDRILEQSNRHSSPLALYNEDNLAMIFALQHYLFCPRQCALIHIEQQWQENRVEHVGAKVTLDQEGPLIV
jgi:CRISPR-associated exonuclease Cas4